MSNKRLAPLIVLSGPAGVGKSTVVERVLDANKFPLRRAITATTRNMRPGEVQSVHYHFWTVERFQGAIEAGQMLEYAVVHGKDLYGTPRTEVDPYRLAGVGVMLVIDVQGAEQIRKQYPGDHCSIFLTVSNFDSLRQRLEQRGEPAASIERRLQTARDELARACEFDKQVANDDLTVAVASVTAIIKELFPTPTEGTTHAG